MTTKNQLRRQRLEAKSKDVSHSMGQSINSTVIQNKEVPETSNVNPQAGSPPQADTLVQTNQTPQSNPSAQANQTPQANTVVKITREQMTSKAKQLWNDFRQYIQTHKDFKSLPDKEKLSIFRDKLGYAEFMNEFPIVSRYIICVGQFNMRAFTKFLDKCEKTVHPPEQMREKGYNEDQWVRRQADYVQYLWEAYQKHHYKTAERQYIWQEAYKRLKGEFDDFRTMYKEVEERVKEEKQELQAQNARELLERISTGLQKLDKTEEEYLLNNLQILVYKKMFGNILAELKKKRKEVDASCEGMGQGPENVPKITMIETVDANRMHEIDDKYKPPELRGMMAVDSNGGTVVDSNGVTGAEFVRDTLTDDLEDYEILDEEVL